MADPDYFTTAELRLLPQMSDSAKYPEARVLAAAAYITSIIEREVGTSFVARTRTDVLDGTGSGSLLVSPFARSLTSVTYADASTIDVADLVVRNGVLRFALDGQTFTAGNANVTVVYQDGYSATPPGDIKEAAIQGTRWRLLATNSNSDLAARQTSLSNDQGGTVQFSIAGEDRPTGYPEVDAVVMGWKRKLDVFGFA